MHPWSYDNEGEAKADNKSEDDDNYLVRHTTTTVAHPAVYGHYYDNEGEAKADNKSEDDDNYLVRHTTVHHTAYPHYYDNEGKEDDNKAKDEDNYLVHHGAYHAGAYFPHGTYDATRAYHHEEPAHFIERMTHHPHQGDEPYVVRDHPIVHDLPTHFYPHMERKDEQPHVELRPEGGPIHQA